MHDRGERAGWGQLRSLFEINLWVYPKLPLRGGGAKASLQSILSPEDTAIGKVIYLKTIRNESQHGKIGTFHPSMRVSLLVFGLKEER